MPDETTAGREPVTYVEIDQDLCALTYGNSPCDAVLGTTGEFKCYNTRKSCQDPTNYDNTTALTLRFCGQQTALPLDVDAIPMIVSVSKTPPRVNVGGRRTRDGSLGKRGGITIVLEDAPHSDRRVDPYLTDRTWDPLQRSTFWAKWLARNPYYNGRSIRLLEGYHGQALADMQTRLYVIDKIEPPDSNGRVTIRGLDLLSLAANDKAKAPELSTGKLDKDYAASGTISALAGAGDYASAGVLRVDKEIIRYTSTVEGGGLTSFIGVTRGSDGTEAAEHEEGATVQQCLEYSDQTPWDVAEDLLTNYGNIDASFIDSAAWAAEAEKWIAAFRVSRIIAEPKGVTELVGELCEQCMFYVWWDDLAQEIKFRAVRPPLPDEVETLTEAKNLHQGGSRTRVRPEERVSEVWVDHGLRSPVESVTDPTSYRNARLRIDPTAASPDEYGERRVYRVQSPWLIGDAQVSPLSYRVLARFRDNPGYFTCELDAKDRGLVALGGQVDIEWRGFVDLQGEPETRRFEVIQLEEVVPGELLRLELQPSQFVSRYAYIMENTAGTYSSYTESTRPALSGFLCPPDTAGDAEKFPDNSDPYVFV